MARQKTHGNVVEALNPGYGQAGNLETILPSALAGRTGSC
jgi:hypothetical protein